MNTNVFNNYSIIGRGGGRPDSTTSGTTTVGTCVPVVPGNAAEYSFTCAANSKDCERFYQYFSQNSKLVPYTNFDLVKFYNWFDNMHSPERSITKRFTARGNYHILKFRRARCDGTSEMVSITGCGGDKKSQHYDIIRQLYGVTQFQNETGESSDGVVTQDSITASNTILTSEGQPDTSTVESEIKILPTLSNSEDSYELPKLTNRWEVFESGSISASDADDFYRSWDLPKALFKSEKAKSANLQLFRNFLYSKLDLEFRIVLNAPKFGQGKLLISWFPDGSDEVDKHYKNPSSMIQRPHVILDMNVTNQAVIRIPQYYRRTFIRNIPHESSHTGTVYANFCTLQMGTLSKYSTGTGQPTTVPYQMFYRFLDASFAGMSYAVEVQMDSLIKIAGDIDPRVALAEKLLKRTGIIGNQDKPYLEENINVVLGARKNFSSGSGISDAIPLSYDRQMTVTTLPEYMNDSDPTSFVDLAQRFGLMAEIEWKNSNKAGEEIYNWNCMPTTRHRATEFDVVKKIPTPLDYAASQFAFWRGTLDLKFLFVSTPYHTGTLQFEISFGREATTLYDNASVYTKTFELGEQREMDLKIPFIYDTPWRRCAENVSWPRTAGSDLTIPGGDRLSANKISSFADSYSMALRFVSLTKLRVRVINPLTPLDQVAKTIKIIVLVKGGSDIQFMGPVPNFWTNLTSLVEEEKVGASSFRRYFHEFPLYDTTLGHVNYEPDYLVPRITQDGVNNKNNVGYKQHKARVHPIKDRESRIIFQNEPTDNFRLLSNKRHFHSTEGEFLFKTMMRRNVFMGSFVIDPCTVAEKKTTMYYDNTLNKNVDLTFQTTSRFWYPICLPTHQLAGFFASMSLGSPLSTIPTIFRHWRGSMRFVLNFEQKQNRIKVAYVPNMGTILRGNKVQSHVLTKCSERSETFRDIHVWDGSIGSLGFATEIVVPSVNPSISISTPFECMFNRCVNVNRLNLGDGSNLKNVIARDESTYISGHIVIEAEQAAKVEIWQSIGDDLNVMNFVGLSEYSSTNPHAMIDSFLRSATTSNVTYQMDPVVKLIPKQDFQIKHVDRKINHVTVQMWSGLTNLPGDIHQTNISMQRTLGQIDANMAGIRNVADTGITATVRDIGGMTSEVTRATREISGKLDQTFTHTNRCIENINNLTSTANTNVNTLTSELTNLSKNSNNLVSKVNNRIDVTIDKLEATTDGVNDVMALIKPMMEKLNGIIMGCCPDNINIVDQSKDFILDLVILIRNFDFINFSIIFVKYITKIFKTSLSTLVEKAGELAKILKKYAGIISTEQSSGVKPALPTLCGFFASLIIGLLNLKQNGREQKIHGDRRGQTRIRDFVYDPKSPNYINSIMTLIERVFTAFSAAIKWVFGYTEVVPTVLDILKREDKNIAKFCMEVDEITDPSNANVMVRADMKAKIWKNFMYARALRKQLVECGGNAAAGVIMGYVNRMCKYCEEEWSSISNCPVRLEPRVICISGESNIGKSKIVDEMAVTLLRAIGYKCLGSNPVYTRAPGRKHWDGYTNQPCIRFDDWINITETQAATQEISDLYELKSTCDFIPPMANITDKGKRANPYLVVLCTNNAFPQNVVDNLVGAPEAVWRRRDKLVYARLRQEYRGVNLRSLPEDVSRNNGHLEFQFGNPLDSNQLIGPTMSYTEMVEALRVDFVEYMEYEKQLAKRKIDIFSEDLPDFVKNLSDPMDLFNFRAYEAIERTTENPEMLPSRMLERQIQDCLLQIRNETQGDAPVKFERLRLREIAKTELGQTNHLLANHWEVLKTGLCDMCDWTVNGQKHSIKLCDLQNKYLVCFTCSDLEQNRVVYRFDEECKHENVFRDEDSTADKISRSAVIETEDRFRGELASRPTRLMSIPDLRRARMRMETYPDYTFVCDAYDGAERTPAEIMELCQRVHDGQIPILNFPFILTGWAPRKMGPKRYKFECYRELRNTFNYPWLPPSEQFEAHLNFRDPLELREWFDTAKNIRRYDKIRDLTFKFSGVDKIYNFTELDEKIPRIDPNEQYCVDDWTFFMIPEDSMEDFTGDFEVYIDAGVDRMRTLIITSAVPLETNVANILRQEEEEDQVFSEAPISRDERIEYMRKKYFLEPAERLDTDYERGHEMARQMTHVYHEREELYRMAVQERGRAHPEDLMGLGEDKTYRDLQIPFKNVTIDMGWNKENVPQEFLSCLDNYEVARAHVSCDHCDKLTIFQYGDIHHHICAECFEKRGTGVETCDFCLLYPTDKSGRFWAKPLLCMYNHAITIYVEQKLGGKHETAGWLPFIFMSVKVISFAAYVVMMWQLLGRFGIWRPFRYFLTVTPLVYLKLRTGFNTMPTSQGGGSNMGSHWNEDWFWKMIHQKRNYHEEDCYHEELLNTPVAGWTYNNYFWNGNQSVFPCKTNCCLFDDDNMETYRKKCKKFASMTSQATHAQWSCAHDLESKRRALKILAPFARNEYFDIPAELEDRFEVERAYKYRAFVNAVIDDLLNTCHINPTWRWLKILAAAAGVLVGAVIAIKGIANLWSWMRGSGESKSPTETQDSYDKAQMRHFKRVTRKPGMRKINKRVGQTDANFTDSLVQKIFKNQFSICIIIDNKIKAELCCVGIQHRHAILPKHYIHAMEEWQTLGAKFELRFPAYPALKITYEFDNYDFIESDTTDLAIFVVPRTVNEFRNIYSYMAKDCDFETAMPKKTILVQASKSAEPQVTVRDLTLYGIEARVTVDRDGQELELDNMLKYNFSQTGACGSLILKPKTTRPIIAIHTAGTTANSWNTFGYGVLLSQETFEDYFRDHRGTREDEYADKEVDEIHSKMAFPDTVRVQSLCSIDQPIYSPEKTQILPTVLNNYDGPPKTAPCYLSSWEPGYKHEISPLLAGCSKHGILTKNFPTSIVHEVKEALYNHKYANMKPLMDKPQVLTIGEAIRGFSIDGYDQLKLDTSMGYPFCQRAKKQKKDYIFVSNEQRQEDRTVDIKKEVYEHLVDALGKRERGVKQFLPVIDALKDERKKLEKRDKLGGTRVFCMSSLASVISNRRNFLHFAAAYKANRLILQHAVGISRDGPEWGVLAHKLLSNSDKIITLDYSNFGPGYNAEVNACAHEIVCKWTMENVTGVNEYELHQLGEEHYNSVHIMLDLVYRSLCGGPSGDALTVVKNGLVNELYILLAWTYLWEEYNEDLSNRYNEFFDNVVLVTYGDDAILSVSDKYIEWFNGETISEFFSRYDIVATDAEKSGSIQKYKSIYEATFLKSGFVPHPSLPGEWLAPMDVISITETPRWIFKCEDLEAATRQNIEQGILLSYGHGPRYFQQLRDKLNQCSKEFGIEPVYFSWRDLDLNYFKNYGRPDALYDPDDAEWHVHVCDKCGVTYVHKHKHKGHHPQFRNQCPNKECQWYHGGDNPTMSTM